MALRVWFAAAWYITSQKQGVSALGLQRVLGLGSYQTAWAMLHCLHRAMVRPDRDLLNGTVEVDAGAHGIQVIMEIYLVEIKMFNCINDLQRIF